MISKHHQHLFGSFSCQRKRKTEIWNGIANEVNAFGPERTVPQWKKCWTILTKTADDKVLMINQYHVRTKGKANCPTKLTDLDRQVLDVGNDQDNSLENERPQSSSPEQLQNQRSSTVLGSAMTSHLGRGRTNEVPLTTPLQEPHHSLTASNTLPRSNVNSSLRNDCLRGINQVRQNTGDNLLTTRSAAIGRTIIGSPQRIRRSRSPSTRDRTREVESRSHHRSRSHRDHLSSRHRNRYSLSDQNNHQCVTRHSSGQCRSCFLSRCRYPEVRSARLNNSANRNIEPNAVGMYEKIEDILNLVQICFEEIRDLRRDVQQRV